MSNINEQQFVDNTQNKFGPTTGSGGGKVNFGPIGGGNNKFGPIGGGNNNKFGPTTPQTNVFDCILSDSNNKLSADKKSVNFIDRAGNFWTWYLDYTFTYKWKDDGSITKGTWECNGSQDYKMKMEDGDSYDHKTGKWAGVPNSGSASNSGGGGGASSSAPAFVETSLTIDDLKAGKAVSKGMKGPVVGEIQKLLIAAGYKNISKSGNVDNRFGSRTKSSVEQFQTANQLKKVDGIVGVETINALLKATPASSQSTEDPNKKPFDPNAEEDNSIPSTDGALIKEKEKTLQESVKKILRNSLLKYS